MAEDWKEKRRKKIKEAQADLRFCQELMNRLVNDSELLSEEYGSINGHTIIENDIVRLRRELNKARKKLYPYD